MSYVLVHLRGDRATEHADRLVVYLQGRRMPLQMVAGESPTHHEVANALTADPVASGVCVGHGSPTGLGPEPHRIWADAARLGRTFHDRRLYVFACDTAGGLDSLAARSVAAGVRVFVGHEGTIEAPLPPAEQRMVEAVAGAAILAFIDGEDDEQALRAAIDDAALELVPLDIPIDHAALAARAPNAWSQSCLFERLAMSVRVHRSRSVT